MTELNLNYLLGKTIKSIGSSFLTTKSNGFDFFEYRIDYKSYFVILSDIKWRYQKILIHSEWSKNISGHDHLAFKIQLGEVFSGTEKDYLLMPYPSSISIMNGFHVKQIDVYGYSNVFNFTEHTKHIIQFTSTDGKKMLLRPETNGLGLVLTLSNSEINTFFNESLNHEFIIHVETFEQKNL